MTATPVRLGLRANAGQFSLLVGLNALVGAMVGLERSVLPLVGARDFGLASKTAILSFIVAFGASKALANLAAGALAERAGRKRLLVAGWTLALPVPVLVGLAPSWGWIVAANLLLGANQGLAWSMTVLMKIDLAGPARRGLALGLNESAGYLGVAAAAFTTGALAATIAPRTLVWAGGAVVAAIGTLVSLVFVRDTGAHVSLEQQGRGERRGRSFRSAFAHASIRHPVLRACSQAGLVNNLNDALAWGLAPLYLAAHGASARQVGAVAAVYPAVWGAGQLGTGWLSDHAGRKPLIVLGMLVQAGALGVLVGGNGAFAPALAAAVLLGLGTALVYPTLIAAVSDAVEPRERAQTVGVYRFWRDAGFVVGALAAGLGADAAGSGATITAVAILTGASGLGVAGTRWGRAPTHRHSLWASSPASSWTMARGAVRTRSSASASPRTPTMRRGRRHQGCDTRGGAMAVDVEIDVEVLKSEIKKTYASVSEEPGKNFIFPTGRAWAEDLGYPNELASVPDAAVESFAGVANPFSLGRLEPGERVLDLGSGAGTDSLVAAQMVGDRGRVTGIDMTPQMLAKARAAAAELGAANVEFVEGEVERLPFPDESFDVVISNGVIDLIPDKDAVFSDIFRVLAPGGRIQIADVTIQNPVSAEGRRNIDLWTG